MTRKLLKVALTFKLGLLVAIVAWGASTATGEEKKDVPTIKEIMVKGHKGTESYIAKIRADAKGGKWDDAKEYAKTLAFFGENLGKNKAPKGEADSWEKLTKKYAESTKAVAKAVDDKDASAVNKALDTINCAECHKAHK